MTRVRTIAFAIATLCTLAFGEPRAFAQGGRVYLEPVIGTLRDSVVQVRLMLAPPEGRRVASFHIAVAYDSMVAHTVRVETHGGLQVANTNVAGAIAIAGVEPKGFSPGLLATLQLRRARSGATGELSLRVLELNDAGGKSLVNDVTVTGYALLAAARTGTTGSTRTALRIDSIAPRAGAIVRDEVLEISVYGAGFLATGNTVLLNGQEAAIVPSETGGRKLRFVAPLYVRAGTGDAEVPVTPGIWSVQLRNVNGQSNRINFTVRGNPQ